MSVRDAVVKRSLGKIKDLEAFEQGNGYRIEKDGVTTALVHNGDPLRFVGYIGFAPNKSRGDHFHRVKRELLFVIEGKLIGKFYLPEQPHDLLTIEFGPGDFVEVAPGCAHSYLSREGAVALEASPDLLLASDTYEMSFEWPSAH